MNRTQLTYAVGITCILISAANLTLLLTTSPKPRIVNITWNKPNMTIDNNTVVYSYMTGVIPRYDPETGKIEITSTTPLQPQTTQTLMGANITQYYENITTHKGTLNWPIWNTTTGKIETYPINTEYWQAEWKGARIDNQTYNGSLEAYITFQKEAQKHLPQIRWTIEGQRNPLTATVPLLGIFLGSIAIIFVRIKENKP